LIFQVLEPLGAVAGLAVRCWLVTGSRACADSRFSADSGLARC